MSHLTTIKGEVRDLELLEKTCERLGYPKPRYVTKYQMFDGSTVDGHAVNLPGWQKPVVFDIESGKVHFDNYSPYTNPEHPQVLSGEKRLGEDGRWGAISKLDRFVDEYQLQAILETAQQEGHEVEVQRTEEEIHFQIHIPG